jgi:hypothetical protein
VRQAVEKAGPARDPTSLFVYETIQYAPQFTDAGPSVGRQIQAATTAGFSRFFVDANTVNRYQSDGH